MFLTYFGVKILRESSDKSAASEEEEAQQSMESMADDSNTKVGFLNRIKNRSLFLKAVIMVFMAEWGDRSMLATIALGASMNPMTVALGATGGHALATLIAVQGGGIMTNYLDEKKVSRFSGSLFLFFALTTLLKVF